MSLNGSMNCFRLASRELFNNYFRISDAYENGGEILEKRFCEVEAVLFNKLVTEPHSLSGIGYGIHQPGIGVRLQSGGSAPIMVNREFVSGYWDHPLVEVTNDVHLSFVQFFDWDHLGIRDNQYVRVVVDYWPSHPEISGFHALIESQYASFTST